MTLYVVMANDYPCGASTTEEGAKPIEKDADEHWAKMTIMSGNDRLLEDDKRHHVYIRTYTFEDGKFQR